jgi:hypothetical protein
MVTVVDYALRTTIAGRSYFVLILQGGIELVKSSVSDRHYATAMKCSMPTTFEEYTCKAMIGKELPGSIVKTKCDSFQVLNKKTGELVQFNHRYEYAPDSASPEKGIFEGAPERAIFD